MLKAGHFTGLAPTALSLDCARLSPLMPTMPRKETNSFVPKPVDDFHIEAFSPSNVSDAEVSLVLTRSQASGDSV